MARTRNIKPGFFTNEELAEIEPLGRLLFAGLWTIADREGRIEDRPKRIKVAILPYDDCDVDALLEELHNRGFITRYKVNGGSYLEITNFAKHQHIVGTEAKSDIPPNPCNSAEFGQVYDECEKKSNELEKKSNKLEEIAPESYSLNLESYNNNSKELLSAEADTGVSVKTVVEHYHARCPSLQKVKELTPSRRQAINARMKELKTQEALDGFLDKVENSDFITGRDGRWQGKRGIDWIFKQQNFIKILEGNYDNPSSKPSFSPEEEERKKEENKRRNEAAMAAYRAKVEARYGGVENGDGTAERSAS